MEDAWKKAFMATAAISVLPTLVLPLIPSRAALPDSGIQKTLLCFAVGGLLGDVFLHLIPHLTEHEAGAHSADVGDGLSGQEEFARAHQNGEKHPLLEMDASEAKHGEEHVHSEEHAHRQLSEAAQEKVFQFHKPGDPALSHPDGLAACPYHRALAQGKSAWQNARRSVEEQSVGLTIFTGFLFFFLCERAIHGFAGARNESGGGGKKNKKAKHRHSHDKSSPAAPGRKSSDAQNETVSKKDSAGAAASAANGKGKVGANGKKDDDGCVTDVTVEQQQPRLKASGILNLAADALHNFTDGIGIGASFASGHAIGVATTLSTMLHELPHEIGDYAVLVQSGMSRWQAIGAQFMTAIGAFIGTGVGLAVSRVEGTEKALLAFTAGGFVYVACVAVLPEVLNSSSGPLQALGEAAAMCAGVALMVAVAALEEEHH